MEFIIMLIQTILGDVEENPAHNDPVIRTGYAWSDS